MFYTLPVTDFRNLPDGEDVNIIDAITIRSIVHSLLASDSPSTPASTDNVRASAHPWANPGPTARRVALDVINASGQDGVAVAVRNALAKGQFTEGTVSTADSIRAASSIAYGTGAQSNAELLPTNWASASSHPRPSPPTPCYSPSAPIFAPPSTSTGSPPHRMPPQRVRRQA